MAIYQYAWLIPVLPLVGAMLVGLGLISLNQVTNPAAVERRLCHLPTGGGDGSIFALLWSQIQDTRLIPHA